jgi:glycosyltransferase involved in cell wall biosynthesis
MMNILHVVRPADGGMKNHVLTLLKHLDPNRYNMFLACPHAGEWQKKIKNPNIKLVELPLKGELSPLADLNSICQLAALMKTNKIHLVHTHGMKAGLVGRLAARLARRSDPHQEIPLTLATVHNSVYNYDLPKIEKKTISILQRYLARHTHRFITVSEALKTEIMLWEGINEENIRVIYNGIPIDTFQKEKSPYLKLKLGLNPIHPVVGTIARLAPQKGVSFFIQAAFFIAQLVDDVQFLVVGDGPLKFQLLEEAERLGLQERMIFTGFYPDISHIYPLIDVFVVPSLSEGLSITTIEAMAAERPIIASDTGGLPELISHHRTGLLVPPGDHQALAYAIFELLKRPRWAQGLARAAREKAKASFTIERMVAETERLYRDIARELKILEPGRMVHAGA